MSELLVTIEQLAEERLWGFIRMTKVEVGGMGYAFIEPDGSIIVREVFLLPQEVTASEVDFESTGGDSVFVERAIADGVLDEPNFMPFSWHSHHTMKPFWSDTDAKRIAAMACAGVKRLLSFVGCHDGDYKMRVDVFGGEIHGIAFPQVTSANLAFAREESEFDRLLADEFDANVKEKKYVYEPKMLTAGSTYTTNGSQSNGKGSKKSSKRPSRGQRDADEHRAIGDLVFEGYTRTDAESIVDEMGVEGVDDLLDSSNGHRFWRPF